MEFAIICNAAPCQGGGNSTGTFDGTARRDRGGARNGDMVISLQERENQRLLLTG